MKFLHTSEGPDQKQLTYPLRLFSGDVAVVADDEADKLLKLMEIIDREPSSVIVCNDAATADVVKNFLISRDVGVVCVNEEIDWLEAQRLARLAFTQHLFTHSLLIKPMLPPQLRN